MSKKKGILGRQKQVENIVVSKNNEGYCFRGELCEIGRQSSIMAIKKTRTEMREMIQKII